MLRLSLVRVAAVGAAVALIAGPAAAQTPVPAAAAVPPQAVEINKFILKGYEAAGVKKPAEKCNDYEFQRRVSIDLIGRIPFPEEVVDFEADKSATKRAKLVRRLLHEENYQPKANGKPITVTKLDGTGKSVTSTLTFNYADEYAEHWANIWTTWLMTRTGNHHYRDQMNFWLETKVFRKNLSHKDMVLALLTATGKTNDNGAVNFLVHHLGEPVKDDNTTAGVDERKRDGAFDAIPVTSRVTKLFLGLQTQCTQCHDHPFNKEWVQGDFWGVNVFFRQTVRSATPSLPAGVGNNNKMDTAVQITLTDDPTVNVEPIVMYERRDARRMASFPVMLKDLAQADRGENSSKRLLTVPAGKTRRQVLADWVVVHDNFSRAYANRMWGHLFGRGLNKEPSFDDFGSNNEVLHPELLDYLGAEFTRYNHDPKAMLEWICTSDVYSLSHVAVKEYTDPKFEPYFARMPLKVMGPEVLFDSLMVATRAEVRANEDERKRLRTAWMAQLVRNFGDDEGNELSFNGTVVQALLMMNGKELNHQVSGTGDKDKKAAAGEKSVIADVVAKRGGNPGAVYDELFLMTLGRHPTATEVAKLEEVRAGKATIVLGAPPAAPKVPAKGPKGTPAPAPAPTPVGSGPTVVAVPGAAAGDIAFYQDVFWALLNTNEFILNH